MMQDSVGMLITLLALGSLGGAAVGAMVGVVAVLWLGRRWWRTAVDALLGMVVFAVLLLSVMLPWWQRIVVRSGVIEISDRFPYSQPLAYAGAAGVPLLLELKHRRRVVTDRHSSSRTG